MNIFEQTPPNRRRYGLAAFIGLIAGVVSAFVKWGAEVPLPPRSPVDMFNAACGPESLIRAAGQIDCRVIFSGNDSNLLIVFYVQIMPDDFVMQLHRF